MDWLGRVEHLQALNSSEVTGIAGCHPEIMRHGNRRNCEVHVADLNPPDLKSGLLLSEDRASVFSPVEPPEEVSPASVFRSEEVWPA